MTSAQQPHRPLVVSRTTSLAKAIVWRIVGVVLLAAVTYYFTRHLITTTKVTIVHHAVFLFVFYAHERLWAKVSWLQGSARHLAKACVYELILGIGIGGCIVYMFTRDLPSVSYITGTYTVIKVCIYVGYDRLWPERKLVKTHVVSS